jgi:hypothetical protein
MLSAMLPALLLLFGRPLDTVAKEDRSGPTMQAQCQIGDEAVRLCRFTRVFGDGSFDIELPDRELRLVVDGDRGNLFEVFGPERMVLLPSRYHRDTVHPACWLSNVAGSDPGRICVYKLPRSRTIR